MLANLLSLPVMLFVSVIQTAAISRITFVNGTADIMLVSIISWVVSDDQSNFMIWALVGGFFISLMTAMPTIAVIISYTAVAGIAWFIHKQLWQSPILTVILSTAIATIIKFLIDVITLQFINIPFSFVESLGEILFPNIILNLFFLFPMYFVMNDLATWLSPKKEINV